MQIETKEDTKKLLKWLKPTKLTISNAYVDAEQQESPSLRMGMHCGTATWEDYLEVFYKAKYKLYHTVQELCS